MELDDLKHIWQYNQALSINQQNIDNEKVINMIRQKSKDIVTKLRKNLSFDIWVSILFIPPLIWVLFQKNIANYHKYVAGFFIIYTFVGIFYYWREIKSYKQVSQKNDLLSLLKFTVEKFSHRVKLLIIYNNILLIPLMIYGVIVGAEVAEFYGHPIQLNFKEILFGVFFATPIAYFYMKYFIKSLYGEHLQKLKQLLAELQQV